MFLACSDWIRAASLKESIARMVVCLDALLPGRDEVLKAEHTSVSGVASITFLCKRTRRLQRK